MRLSEVTTPSTDSGPETALTRTSPPGSTSTRAARSAGAPAGSVTSHPGVLPKEKLVPANGSTVSSRLTSVLTNT